METSVPGTIVTPSNAWKKTNPMAIGGVIKVIVKLVKGGGNFKMAM